MLLEIILILSILFQITAIFLALPLVSTTGRREAWILISFSMILMGGQRILSLVSLMSQPEGSDFQLWFETFGLLASVCVCFSIIYIRAYFNHSLKVEKALRESREDLRYLSSHDVLTGLYNRNYFEMLLSRLNSQGNFPLSVLIADVDDLKHTNDQHGHAAGDDILKQVAEVFTSVFRETDMIARMGGDEFAVLLPGTDENEAQRIFQRFQEEMERRPKIEGLPCLRLSAGMATAFSGEEIVRAIHLADEHMYENKEKKKSEQQPAALNQNSITHMPAHPAR